MNGKRFSLLVLTAAVALIVGMASSYVFMAKNARAQEEEEKHTMFARLTIASIKSDKMDELMGIYKESIIPAAKTQEGYKAAYLLTNRETGKAISVSVWDSEEKAIDNEQSGYYQEQVDKAMDCFAEAPVREGYDISVSDEPSE